MAVGQVCRACYGLIERIRPEHKMGATGPVHTTATSFFHSVDTGCLVCTYLNHRFFENADELAHAVRAGAVVTKSPFIEYTVYLPDESEQQQRRGRWLGVYLRLPSFELRAVAGERERTRAWTVSVPEGASADDDHIPSVLLEVCWPAPGRSGVLAGDRDEVQDLGVRWPRVAAWLRECLDGHPECVSNSTRSWTPSRLLDLASTGAGDLQREASSDYSISLCLAEECVPSAPYMTLSHCWGVGQQPLRLLSTNLQDMRSGISIKRLPTTFQQAVAVTRRLGVRYLWIDSLCIIQDSKEDWFYESERMCDVYRHSYCNVAATSARNGTEGCFFSRTPSERPPWTFKVGFPPVRCEIYDQEVAHREFRDAPLNTRAWVLQERLLAPRVLHFGRQRLYWECNRHFTYEDEAKAPEDAESIEATRTMLKGHTDWHHLEQLKVGLSTTIEYHRLHDVRDDDLSHVRKTLYAQWLEIVQHYSACNLTVAADKLIALAGVAKRIQPILDDDYLAGIWRGHTIRELLWKTLDEAHREYSGVLQSAYRAPSWSWASLDGRVSFVGAEPSSAVWNATIEDAGVVHASGGDPIMGPFSGGFVRVRGKPFQSLWRGRRTQEEAFAATAADPDAAKAFFGTEEPSLSAFRRAYARLRVDPFDEHGLFRFKPNPAVDAPGALHRTGDHEPAERLCLALQLQDPSTDMVPPGHEEEYTIGGLLLCRVDRPECDRAYRRAGVVFYLVRGDIGLERFHNLADETVTIV